MFELRSRRRAPRTVAVAVAVAVAVVRSKQTFGRRTVSVAGKWPQPTVAVDVDVAVIR
jgi:hypothetical protein